MKKRFQHAFYIIGLIFLPAAAAEIQINKGDLQVTFANNQGGMSGMRRLSHVKNPANTFYGSGSGNNLEFIFTGDKATYGWDIFAPRNSPHCSRSV